MKNITSNKNSAFKLVKSLNEKKYRESHGMFFIEGLRFVEEAVKAGSLITKLFLSESFLKQPRKTSELESFINSFPEVYVLPDSMFLEISDTENPQGIIAVVRMSKYNIEDMMVENGFVIMLEGVRDPGNMGTILRTADAARASGVLVSKGSVDVYNSKVLRSTMGSIFHLPIVFTEDLVEDIKILKESKFKILASHIKGDVNYFDVPLNDKIGIIIGSEAFGVSDEVTKCADRLVKIPMPGNAESLNASVAAGIMIFEVVRQRSFK